MSAYSGGGYGLPSAPSAATVQPSWAQRNVTSYDEPTIIVTDNNDSPAVTDSVGSGSTPQNLIPIPQSAAPMKKTPRRRVKELNCCEKLFYGGCIQTGTIKEHIEEVNPGLLAADSSIQQGGVILMARGAVAIFPEEMPEMEDCFYNGMGVIHSIFTLAYIGLAVTALAVGCNLRFTLAGIWCGAPICASAVFSFIVARRETRTNVKKLVICVSLAFCTSIAFTIISYMSATVDGVYYKWADIAGNTAFKARSAVDGIGMVSGAVEAIACLAHMASLLSNLKGELIYRCCSRRRFRRFLKEEGKKQEAAEERHLHKKKELLQKLIGDLEEEERYKEKWQRQQNKLLGKQQKEAKAWGEA